jgi:peptide/nickel transport system substrate-binding protein
MDRIPEGGNEPRGWRSGFRFGAKKEELADAPASDLALVAHVTHRRGMPSLRQWRYAWRVFSVGERQILVSLALLALLAGGGGAALLVREKTVPIPATGGTLTEAIVGEPRYLNPLDAPANDADKDLVRLIYAGLFRFDGLEAVPDLAERYSWSEDGKTLTVTLRGDTRFHDGAPLTAEDVRFTFDALLNPERASPLAGRFRDLSVIASDEATVVFTLPKADPNFLGKLTVGILPAHLWQSVAPAHARLADLNLKPIGAGPYRVKSFTRDERGDIHAYTLERATKSGSGPLIENIVFQFYPDRDQALDAFRSELVDAVAFAEPTEEERAKLLERSRSIEIRLPEESAVFFNTKDPILASPKVREALALAIDRTAVTALVAGARPVDGPYPFAGLGATSSSRDLLKAKSLLDSAGWTATGTGARIFTPRAGIVAPKMPGATTSTMAAGSPLELTLTVPDDPRLLEAASLLQAQWGEIGVPVRVESLSVELVVRQATKEKTSQITLVDLLLPPDENLFPFWWSGLSVDRAMNFSNIADRSVDDALDKIRQATTTEALAAAKSSAGKVIANAKAAVFLYQPSHLYLLSPRVQGATSSLAIPEPSERLQDIGNWFLETDRRWK